jgi:hypothetical protein
MKLNARQDIEASASEVFRLLTDFGLWERDALRRGAEVQRTDRLAEPGVGMTWDIRFSFRGAAREVALKVVKYEPGVALGLEFDATLLEGHANIDLVALSARRTRLQLKSEVTSKTLVGRILLQSLRLAKGRINERIQSRLAAFAVSCEDRAQASRAR